MVDPCPRDGRSRPDGQRLLVAINIAPIRFGYGDRAMADQLAQRLICDGADVLLLELRDRRAVDRPVSGIVHPRRDLVDQAT
jgi:hypothetical protein